MVGNENAFMDNHKSQWKAKLLIFVVLPKRRSFFGYNCSRRQDILLIWSTEVSKGNNTSHSGCKWMPRHTKANCVKKLTETVFWDQVNVLATELYEWRTPTTSALYHDTLQDRRQHHYIFHDNACPHIVVQTQDLLQSSNRCSLNICHTLHI